MGSAQSASNLPPLPSTTPSPSKVILRAPSYTNSHHHQRNHSQAQSERELAGDPSSTRSTHTTTTANNSPTIPFTQLLAYVLPIYYTKEPLTKEEKEKLFSTWKLIRLNKAAGFYRLKKEDPEFTPCGSPMEFFANRFTIRLIEVHPVCQSMFTKTTLKQGSMVMNMISSLLGCLEEEEAREKEAGDGANGEEKEIGGVGGGGRKGTGNAKFVKQLEMLATSHTRLGVRASEFGIFGEVLFWALRLTLGSEDYDFTAHTAWIKFYSRMLEVIVPMVLKYETEHRESFSRFNAKRMMPVMQVKNMIAEGLKE